jgi:hypothetical protein
VNSEYYKIDAYGKKGLNKVGGQGYRGLAECDVQDRTGKRPYDLGARFGQNEDAFHSNFAGRYRYG